MTQVIQKPSLLLFLTEGLRSVKERVGSIKFRKEFEPQTKGDGHPVLVIPGFLAGELSTKPLREFIDKIGYTSYDWKLGRNYGQLEDIDTLLLQVDELYESHQQRISLIGWSLGGIYSRELAKQRPRKVRQIITMGSPFQDLSRDNYAKWAYRLLNGKMPEELDAEILASIPRPAPRPTTAIYSKNDGIVPWMLCIEKEKSNLHQNIEVESAHLGMGFDKVVLELIANQLVKHGEQ